MYLFYRDKIKGVLSAYETERPERDVSHNFQNEIIPSSGIQSKSEITTELMVHIHIYMYIHKCILLVY